MMTEEISELKAKRMAALTDLNRAKFSRDTRRIKEATDKLREATHNLMRAECSGQ